MRLRLALIAALPVLVLAHGAASPAPSPVPSAAPSADPGLFSDADGRFTVKFPVAPHELPSDGRGPRSWVCETPQTQYAMEEVPLPRLGPPIPGMPGSQRDPNALFDKLRDATIKALGARLLEERPIDLGAYPGRQFKFAVPGKAKGICRNYVVRDRLYSLNVQLDIKAKPTPAVKAFLGSLTVKPLWYRLQTSGKRATCWFPDKPQQKTEHASVHRVDLAEQMNLCELDGGQAAYCFNTVDFTESPDVSGMQLVDRLRDMLLAQLKAKLVSEAPISLRGYPGKQLEAQAASGMSVRARVLFAEMCAYFVYVVSIPGRAPDPLDDQFLQGFELSEHP